MGRPNGTAVFSMRLVSVVAEIVFIVLRGLPSE